MWSVLCILCFPSSSSSSSWTKEKWRTPGARFCLAFFESSHDAQISTYLLCIPSNIRRELSDTYVSRNRCRGQVAISSNGRPPHQVTSHLTDLWSRRLRGIASRTRMPAVAQGLRMPRSIVTRLLFTKLCIQNSLDFLSKFVKFWMFFSGVRVKQSFPIFQAKRSSLILL